MKKGEKKKQQKALKRRTESNTQRHTQRAIVNPSPLFYVRQARNFPIEGCWVRRDWQESGLAVIVLTRRQPNGNLVFGNYLVDYYCLGLKDTFFKADIPPGEFKQSLLPRMFQNEKPLEISPALAHEIIYGAIEYAARFGFKPQRDFRNSQYILDPIDMHPRSGQVEFGKNGKPLFINGPYDNVDRILLQLRRTAGDGNFDFLAMLGPADGDFDDDELTDEADE